MADVTIMNHYYAARDHLAQAVLTAARAWAKCPPSGGDEHGSIEDYCEALSEAVYRLDVFDGQDTSWFEA